MRHKKFSTVGEEIQPSQATLGRRPISKIIVHCSATPPKMNSDAKDIDRWHVERWGSTSGCGYHYVILKDGTLQRGRSVNYNGAHARGNNAGTIGICYIGGLNADNRAVKEGLNPEQRKTLMRLLKQLRKHSQIQVLGHNELPRVNKACPCTDMKMVREGLRIGKDVPDLRWEEQVDSHTPT